jgi:hypothetical protein
MIHLKEKKLKYKRIARKLKETLAKREQEATDLIVDNTELKSTLDRTKRESRQEIEKLRGEVGRLMEDNHRYSRDLDRLLKDNSDIKDLLSAATHRQELTHQNLQRMILDKEKEIEKLNFNLSERGVETQRLAK